MFKEEELTRKIIGVAMSVHRALGPGFKENVYHKALLISLRNQNTEAESEKSFQVIFNGAIVGNFRVDIFIEHKVIVELKAVDTIMPRIFKTQLVSYLKAAKVEVGLLINFGKPSLEYERIVHYYNP